MRIVLITCLIFLVGITETRAQEILIPYRTGNQWGLADTMGSIKLTPRYDTLINPLFRASSYRQSTFYIFKKAGKQGLTSANAEILPPEHKLLQYAAGSFIRSLVSDAPKIEHGYGLWKYYTLNGDLVTNDTLFNVFYNYDIRLSFPGHFSLAAARLKNKNYTIYLVDREEDKVIQTLISNVTSYNYINKKRYLVLLEIETNSNIKLNYELSYNSILKKIEMKKVPLKKEEEEEYEMDEIAADEYGIYDSEYYEIEEGESATKKGKLAEIVIFGFEHKKLVMKTFVGQVDRMSNQSELRLAQVKVFPKIKEKNTQIKGYETNIDKRSSNAFKDKSGDLVYQNNYAMYLKQGLIGIVTKYGQINPQFKTVLGIGAKFDKGDIPSFIVSKMIEGKEKFGIVSANGKYLVPLGL